MLYKEGIHVNCVSLDGVPMQVFVQTFYNSKTFNTRAELDFYLSTFIHTKLTKGFLEQRGIPESFWHVYESKLLMGKKFDVIVHIPPMKKDDSFTHNAMMVLKSEIMYVISSMKY